VNELTSQLTQQTEYSASMGAACATLLWRVSRRDDAVETLLTGVSVVTVDHTILTYSRQRPCLQNPAVDEDRIAAFLYL